MPPAPSATGANPVLWIMLGVPAVTVCASMLTLFLAARGADPPLPPQYAWEGRALERDQARAERATVLGAAATLDFGSAGALRVGLAFDTPDASLPATLQLHLTHATLPSLDRRLRLVREGAATSFSVELPPLARGHWLVELAPAAPDVERAGNGNGGQASRVDDWRLRGEFKAPDVFVRLGR